MKALTICRGRNGRRTWQNLLCSCKELRARCSQMINAMDIDEGSYEEDEEGIILARFPRHANLESLTFTLGYRQVSSVLQHTHRFKPSRLTHVTRITLEDIDDKLRGRLINAIVETCPSASTLSLRVAGGYYHSLRTTPQFFKAFESATQIKTLSFESPLSRTMRGQDVAHLVHISNLCLCHQIIDQDVVQALVRLPELTLLDCESMSLVSPIHHEGCKWKLKALMMDHHPNDGSIKRLLHLPNDCDLIVRSWI